MDFFQITINGIDLYHIGWLFIIYSFMGVVVETLFCYAKTGTIECRTGTLYLPLIPVYGIGAVALTVALSNFFSEPILLFFGGIIVGSIVEYVCSYVMDKLFHTVFWDYSDLPLNIHGRICLEYSIYWGFLSLILVYVLDKYAAMFIGLFDRTRGEIFLSIVLVLAVVSFILTLLAFVRFRRKVDVLEETQNGGTATTKLSHSLLARLVDILVPDKVMIFTFPNMNFVQEYMKYKGIQKTALKLDFRINQKTKSKK